MNQKTKDMERGRLARLLLVICGRDARAPIQTIFACIIMICISLTGARAADKPNIIFVLCDDLGFGDYGVFWQNLRAQKNQRGEPWHQTPNIDKFAAQGAQLPNHYCPAPVCAPSRASLLLGVTQGHANVRDNQFDKELENNHTIASVLQQGGYATCAIGKWGLQGAKTGEGDWAAHPQKRGFDYYFGYIAHKDGHAHYPKEDGKNVWDGHTEISAQLDKCYTTDLFTARAKKWIGDQHQQKPNQPFFLYLAYDTPHAKLQLPTVAYLAGGGLKGGVQWTGKAGQMINTATGTPDSYYHPDYAGATWDNDKDAATPETAWPDVYKRYATDVRRIDDCLGDLMQQLKDLKIDDNTLVVFSTDNGPSRESYLPENYEPNFFNSFGPFDGIKRDCLEGGIRVGALARWPAKIPAGRVAFIWSGFWDWLATFADAAQIPSPARSDGVSLLPSLTGQGTQKDSTVYIEYFEGGKTPNYQEFLPKHRGAVRKQMQFVRFGDFVGVRYNVQKHADDFEIYDIAKDPQEKQNLAKNQPALQQRMKDAVLQSRRPNESAKRPYDDELIPSLKGVGALSGVRWQAYGGPFPYVPELTFLTASKTGINANIPLETGPIPPYGAGLFAGYIEAPSDGEYTFYLTAHGKAFLRLHNAQLIDADFGYESDSEVSAKIKLQKGKHPFRLSVVNKDGASLKTSLQWSGPNLEKQPIPDSAFSRNAG